MGVRRSTQCTRTWRFRCSQSIHDIKNCRLCPSHVGDGRRRALQRRWAATQPRTCCRNFRCAAACCAAGKQRRICDAAAKLPNAAHSNALQCSEFNSWLREASIAIARDHAWPWRHCAQRRGAGSSICIGLHWPKLRQTEPCLFYQIGPDDPTLTGIPSRRTARLTGTARAHGQRCRWPRRSCSELCPPLRPLRHPRNLCSCCPLAPYMYTSATVDTC